MVMTARLKRYIDKQRGKVLGSEATSLAACHMMNHNPPKPIALSHRTIYIPFRAAMALWLLHYPKYLKRALHFFHCSL